MISIAGDTTSPIASINSGQGNERPFMFIDGKKEPLQQMKSLTPDKIASISMLKGQAAIKEHGEEGENSLILVTTKKK